jgi:hypothetical protein
VKPALTVRQLIEQLQGFQDKDLPVYLDVNSWLENRLVALGLYEDENGVCVYLSNDADFLFELQCTGDWVPGEAE